MNEYSADNPRRPPEISLGERIVTDDLTLRIRRAENGGYTLLCDDGRFIKSTETAKQLTDFLSNWVQNRMEPDLADTMTFPRRDAIEMLSAVDELKRMKRQLGSTQGMAHRFAPDEPRTEPVTEDSVVPMHKKWGLGFGGRKQ